MKLVDKIKKRFLACRIKRLSKTAVVFENNYERMYIEPGCKSYGRLHMFKSVDTALKYIHGFDYETKLGIQSIGFDENEDFIFVKILLHRPGLLIGKMGSCVNDFENTLSGVFGKQTKVCIEEAHRRMYGLDFIHTL